MKNYILSEGLPFLRPRYKFLLISNLIVVFLLFSIFQVQADGMGQTVTIEQKNIAFVDALREIKRQTGYTVVCSSEILKSAGPSNLSLKNVPLFQALEALLTPKGLTFYVEGKSIAIKKANSQSATKPEEIKTQLAGRPIQGIVTKADGQPLGNVTVSIKSKNRVTTTDNSGAYTISADAGDVITFKHVGYKLKEITLADQQVLNVSLIPEETSLQEVVVVGYGVTKKMNLTGSVESVKSAELEKMPVVNTATALSGKVPGLVLKQSSGQPGNNDPVLNIRGFGSPLVIIDGTQQGSFGNLDIEEIESITVLKDAAAAVYGAQAGNGVVLVTTKRGGSGMPKITFNSAYTLSTPTRYPKMMSAGEYAELYNEAQLNDGVAPANLRFSTAAIAAYKNQNDPANYPNTDWFDVAARQYAPQYKNNLNVNGGGENVKYFFSLGQASEGGLWRSGDSEFKRYNVRSNLDVKVTPSLTATIDLAGRNESRSNPNISVNDIFLNILRSQPIYAPTYPDPTKYAALGRVGANGLISTQKDVVGYLDDDRNYFTGSFKLRYDIPFVKNLYAEGRLTYFKDEAYLKNWSQQYSTYNYDAANNVYSLASQNGQTALTESQAHSRRMTHQYSLNYDRTFDKHSFKGLLLFEGINEDANNLSATRRNYISTAVQQLFAGGTDSQSTFGTATQNGRASYIGRLNYAFDSKYLLEATFRYDGSPRFAENRRWGFFPSLSLGWNISDENFLSEVNWLDNLKLRLSFSNTGNDGTGNFQYLTGYQYNSTYMIGTSPKQTIVSTGLANPYISWEDLTTYNVGLETRVFGSFGASLDVFYRKREGMLATRAGSLPFSFGAVLPSENINSQDNRGFEFVLNYRRKFGNFSTNLSGNVSYSRAKWIHFEEPVYEDGDQIRINQRSGRYVNQTFGYMTDGFFQSKEQIGNWPINQDGAKNATLKPGDLIYKDLNNDKIINWRDQALIGKGDLPNWYYGLNTDFSWKDFSVNALWQGAAGFNFQITADAKSTFTQDQNGYQYFYANRWTPGRTDAQYPRASVGLPANQDKLSDFWYKKASYLRLKSLMLSYSLPKKLTKRISSPNLSIFVAGTNLLTFDNLSDFGYDPEAPSWNSGLYYPQQTTYTLGLKANL